MKCVLLDAFFLSDDNLSSLIEALPNLKIYKSTKSEQVVERSKDAEIILTNKCILNKSIIDQLSHLKFIQVMATGINNVDAEHAQSKGITVKNITDYSSQSVATYILSSILNLLTSAPTYLQDVSKGRWIKSETFTFLNHPISTPAGKKLGIIGYGSIGKKISSMVRPLGMEVLIAKGRKDSYPEERLSIDTILRSSDILLLCCTLSSETENLICKSSLSLMKPEAFLINAARGGLVNEQDLADALNRNIIAGAALDVLSKEPPQEDNPLLKCTHKKLYITPHIAWAAASSIEELVRKTLLNCKKFIENNNR